MKIQTHLVERCLIQKSAQPLADIRDRADHEWHAHEAEEPLRAWLEFYQRRGAPFVRHVPPLGEFRRTPNIGFVGMPFMVGTVADVGERLRALLYKAPLDEMGLYFHAPGIPVESVKKSMTLFAKHILPDIKDWGGPK